jgi:hypothetical protein
MSWQILYDFRDWVFPHPQPLSADETKKQKSSESAALEDWSIRTENLPNDTSTLAEYLNSCTSALSRERDRAVSADSRLTTIVGLSSIAVSVVFGVIISERPPSSGCLGMMIFLTPVYLVLQLVSAMFAGTKGLGRRSYRQGSAVDLLPSNETRSKHLRRQIADFYGILAQHQEQNNKKITQMAVAHRALKNFVWGILLLTVIGATANFTVRPSADLSGGEHRESQAPPRDSSREVVPAIPQSPIEPPTTGQESSL